MSNMLQAKAQVWPDGLVTWSRPGIITVSCNFDLKDFPFDTQICKLRMASWAYDAGILDVRVAEHFKPPIDMNDFVPSEEFEFTPGAPYIERVKFDCCPDPFEYIYFPLVAKRKSAYYMNIIFWPAIIICALNFCAFII